MAEAKHDDSRPLVAAALLAAAAFCWAATGYSFESGNHEVYLLDPLRRAGLATFAGDPFVHGTLQYHGLFSLIAAGLYRLNVAAAGFLALFLILLGTTVWAWWRLCRSLGGSVTAFLASVVAYHVLLGDRALGFYSLLQDGQFNAGNVAAVALLVGIALWLERRIVWAAVAFGVAGAFHLNYAVVCPMLWVALVVLRRSTDAEAEASGSGTNTTRPPNLRRPVIGTAVALLPSILNVAFALPAKLGASSENALPLGRFVELYVRLRHPHHYDPSAWPWWVWLAFLLPIPLAVLAWRRQRTERPWNDAAAIWVLLIGLQLVALLFAGVFYISETAIQMSLWRFSPHAKLLAVTAAATLIRPSSVYEKGIWSTLAWAMTLMVILLAGTIWKVAAELRFAQGEMSEEAAQSETGRRRLALLDGAAWARENTNRDALFLVPPGAGSAFPVNARRGHVVSFKLVPQLSGELAGWEGRLKDVLAVDDLSPYAGGLTGYITAQQQMDTRYGELSADHLFNVAADAGADYVLTLAPLPDAPSRSEIWRGNSGAVVYAARVQPASRPDEANP